MNTKGILLSIVLAFVFNWVSAQDFEGKIETVMTYVDNEDIKDVTKVPLTTEFTVKGERTKIKTNLAQLNIEMLIIVDHKKERATMACGAYGYGVVVDMGKDHFGPKSTKEYQIKYTKQTKKILGYTCKKAIVYKSNLVQEVWYTKSLTKLQEGELPYIDGFVMEYNDIINDSKVKFTVTSIKKKSIQDEAFNPPVEYVQMSKEDAMKGYGFMMD